MAASSRPEVISRMGFVRAPVSKFLIINTGVSSALAILMPETASLLSLNWNDVCEKRELWRLVTSQLATTSVMDMVSNFVLIYQFLVLERRWGSSKYASFLLTSWSLSLGLYFSVYKLKLLDFLNVRDLEVVPSGLQGPLFALFVCYTDLVQSDGNSRFSFGFPKRFMMYIAIAQMLFSIDKPQNTVMCLCGVVAGLLYKSNIFNIQRWLIVPDKISSICRSIFTFLGIVEVDETVSRKTLMGATTEINEDILYDYMTSVQQNRARIRNRGRVNIGQGYADVMNPQFEHLFANIHTQNQRRPVISYPQPLVQNQQEVGPEQPVPTPGPSTSNVDLQTFVERGNICEEKAQALVDMGFAREAVVNALASTNNDINQATSILLSSTT